MQPIFTPDFYNSVMTAMFILAVIVFVALQKITAPYGMAYSSKWGISLPNRIGWILMELPAFVVMLLYIIFASEDAGVAAWVIASLFLLHYAQRTFIFPLKMRGKNKMPVAIVAMGAIFNTINAYMIGTWLFYLAPKDLYTTQWLYSPYFIIGVIIFFAGMIINMHSDYVVRHLRKPGDSKHYIPRKGMYKYVSGANYFGELTEWAGYAILSWSLAGLLFFVWTFANLVPRAAALHHRYEDEFGQEYIALNRKRVFPFIY
jgi:3-oxo-5-alpha-steroid 4-dehydrogenase 1